MNTMDTMNKRFVVVIVVVATLFATAFVLAMMMWMG